MPTIIDIYLDQYLRRYRHQRRGCLDREILYEILEGFLINERWLETSQESDLLESAFEGLTRRLAADLTALDLLQLVRAHVSLLRVKLSRSDHGSAVMRQKFRRRSR